MSDKPNKQNNELGCVWKKQGSSGAFYSGSLTINGEKIEIVMFPNTRKPQGSSQPDWRIFRSIPREQRGNGTAPAPQVQASQPAPAAEAPKPRPVARSPRPQGPTPTPSTPTSGEKTL